MYEQYGRAAFEERVKGYATQTGVTEADARVVLQQASADGSFTPELTPVNLMKFLDYGANLAKRAGFKGLLILIDELQQFFGGSADVRGTIQKLREVILWLASHGNLSLGMILCMPDSTESIIQEDGQDILDRLKTDRRYISLRNIYSPDFPSQLWDRYVELYQAQSEADRIIDRHLLASTGQIATREDLGRGPRTVIDVFQCALRHYDKTKEKYTPVTLIDDFLTGQISFDMQANPIRFAVEDALSLLKNQATSVFHQKAIKLWAAFPEHGCPDEVLESYGAKEAAYELSEMHGVHGPLLTYQSVGYTLRKLATFAPSGMAVERIARDFWLAYKEQDPKWTEAAQSAFINRILPRLFEKRQWGNWELVLTTAKSYGGRLTGTFSDQYPKRILDLQVAIEPTRIEPRRADAQSDFQFDFVLWQGPVKEASSDPGRIEHVADNPRWIRFNLNIGSRALAGANLPQDLRNLKSSIHPNFLTPQLMLAFVDYVKRWESIKPDNRILESERGPVDAIIESMINYSVRVLFNEELKATFGQKLDFTGLQIVREIFILTCKSIYPPGTYYPLLTISDRAFRDYQDALSKLSLREKRGEVPLSERQKGKLASLFGIDSHKTFENRAKNDYAHLMQYTDLGGDQAQVQLQLHPLEVIILNEMSNNQARHQVEEREVPFLEGSQLLSLYSISGYRDEEAAMILRLLVARELVRQDNKLGIIYRLPVGPSPQEVERRLKALHTQVHSLPTGLIIEREKEPLIFHISAIQDHFSSELDEESLEEISVQAERLETDLASLVNRKCQNLLDGSTKQVQEVQRRIGALDRISELEEDIPAGLDFRRHLVDLQESLRHERRKLRDDLNGAYQQLKDLHDRAVTGLNAISLPDFYKGYTQATTNMSMLSERADRFERQRQGLLAWLKLLKESDLLYKSLSTMPNLRRRLTNDIVPEIMRNFTLSFAQKNIDAITESAEYFRNQFDEITRERDAQIAIGNQAFGEIKKGYRQWLADMGVERPDFPARYSPLEHDQSYQDMYEQIKRLAVSHLEHLAELIRTLDLDARKAQLIHFQKLSDEERNVLGDLEKRRTDLQDALQTIRIWLEKADLTQDADLDEQARKIASIDQDVKETDETIRRLILRPVEPQTSEEKKVISLLASRREVDLTELILSSGDELDLEKLMRGLIGLYQGNQVSIKVQKRG